MCLFFFKQKTAYEMRISDWSSDVCSSDLRGPTATVNYVAAVMAPAGINIATGIAPRWQSFNVIISNVPGPKRTLHWNGARLDGMYPVSVRSEEHTSELQSLMRISYAVFCLKKKKHNAN